MGATVPLDEIRDEKYRQIICYPRYTPKEFKKRINDMKKLGVKAVCFEGSKIVMNVPVLGKGYVGIVLLVILKDGSKAALKIRRTDVESERIIHEFRMLSIANSVNVGPRALGYTDNLLMMEYIEGNLLPEWIKKLKKDEKDISRLYRVLKDILEQCWRLDSVGLDHGELSRADKHIIVDAKDRAYILDFEEASDKRRTANVTSISQYLFIRGETAKLVTQKIGQVNVDRLIRTLKTYKRKSSRKNFELILETLKLKSLLIETSK